MLVARRAGLRWYAVALTLVTIVVTKGAPRTGVLTQSFGYTLFAIAFALLVLHAVIASANAPSEVRLASLAPLRAVGRYSYAMYLFHTPLHLLVGMPLIARLTGVDAHGEHGLPFALAYFVGAAAVTFLAGLVSYHGFEKHFLALKRWMVPRGAA